MGNGGVPQLLPDPPLATLPNDPGHAPLTWAYDGNEAVEGDQWLRFGFAVLDFNGAELTIRYIDERNNEVNRVTLG